MFSSADESLMDETRLLLHWDNSLVTLHTFALIHITSEVNPVQIFMTRSTASKSCLMAEPCFHRFVHFGCVPMYIVGF